MYYEYNYGICSEIFSDSSYSSRFPYRKLFATQEDVDKWIEEMDKKYGETGWRLGDENIYEGEMPKPRKTISWAEADRRSEEAIAAVGKAWEEGQREFATHDEELRLEIYLSRKRYHRYEL